MTLFNLSKTSAGIELSFSATLENIDRAAAETKCFLQELGMEEKFFNVLLCMREALLNAVMHGSGKDPGKIITYHLRKKPGSLIMEVEDGGEGFLWRKRLRTEPGSGVESGRGLTIMKKYATDIYYNQKGNRLTLIKKI